ncbi:hypothetical protein J3Q64DRAFT_1633591 [Phycomyces blakesleeanus]|uniref:Transcription regulator Rua1 C-terminal domain-containing protein n=1 Tax=Phycomyces blakesleeanus TaxID=4837 RepID=A0ABR3BA98_PHYBL
MDVQGYMHNSEDAKVTHYAEPIGHYDHPTSKQDSSSSSPLLTPMSISNQQPQPEQQVIQEPSGSSYDENNSNNNFLSPPLPQSPQPSQPPSAHNPAIMRALKDKRKSSPAILGLLGLGDEAEAQLSMHLSQHRNSIEAAMLLANFNRLQTTSVKSSPDLKAHGGQWQDDMSIASHTQTALSNDGPTESTRRYSYDATMSWNTMPPAFVDRATLLQDIDYYTSGHPHSIQGSPSAKLTWYQNGRIQEHHHLGEYGTSQSDYAQHPTASIPPNSVHYSLDNIGNSPHHQQQQQQQQHHPSLQPTPQTPTPSSQQPQQSQPQPPPPPPPMHPHHPHPYYYHHGKLPIPSSADAAMIQAHNAAVVAAAAAAAAGKPKRRKTRNDLDDDEMLGVVEPGDADFPDMSLRDIEAARVDPEARPRRQKLRYVGDLYTPQWVRYNGQAKEGLCDTCKPGRWLQLKNSAFWYHKQFFHGISSVSGKEFMQPLETRWVDQDLVEGLCHQCHQWVSVSNCHVYHKPKSATPKRR